jgi:hypothetical protein
MLISSFAQRLTGCTNTAGPPASHLLRRATTAFNNARCTITSYQLVSLASRCHIVRAVRDGKIAIDAA